MSAWYEARRPRRWLDGCCGIGGISAGLARAGHDVTGVDINPRLRDDYLRSGAARFICADITEILADRSFMAQFDFTSVSPPCQDYSLMSNCRPELRGRYPRLIRPCQSLLDAWGGPFIIENVKGAWAELRNPVTLCMQMFGRETYRHRLLESGGGLVLTPPAPPPDPIAGREQVKPNRECGWPHPVPTARAGHWRPGYFVSVAGHERKEPVRHVMEIGWARNRDDIKEAVPPYVGQWIAEQASAWHAERNHAR